MKLMRYLVPSLLAGSLVAGGASAVFAAQHSGASAAHKKHAAHHAFAYGQVSNLSGAGFTLTRTPKKATSPKVVQVALGATTKEKARKGTTGPLTNGEYAFVVGTKSTSGLPATRVLYSTTPFKAHRLIRRMKDRHIVHRATRRMARRHLAGGMVNAAATTSTSISITTAKGKTLVFAMTPHTKYRVNKVLSSTAPTFTNGEKVRIRFAHNRATKTRTARMIIVNSRA